MMKLITGVVAFLATLLLLSPSATTTSICSESCESCSPSATTAVCFESCEICSSFCESEVRSNPQVRSCDGLCENGGTCDPGDGYCICASGFSGNYCEVDDRPEICSSYCESEVRSCDGLCENGGTCNPEDGSCTCVLGFSGIDCEIVPFVHSIPNCKSGTIRAGEPGDKVYYDICIDDNGVQQVAKSFYH